MFIIAISKNNNLNIFQSGIVLILLILLITFRDSSMADYSTYTDIFNYQIESVEPFHILVINFLKARGFSVIAYFFIVAMFTVTFQINAIRRVMTNIWGLSMLTWLGTSFILNDMVTIRAGLAASLLLWLVYYKVANKLFYAILLFLLAISIHISAAVFIIVFFLSPIIYHRKYYLIGLGISVLCPMIGFSLTDFIGVVGINLFDEKMLIYINSGVEANPLSLFQLVKFAIAIILWMRCDRIIPKNKYFLISLKIYTIGCIWYFMTYKLMAVAWRISCMFWTVDVFVYPFLAYLWSKELTPRSKLIPAGVSVMFFVVNVSMQQYWNPV